MIVLILLICILLSFAIVITLSFWKKPVVVHEEKLTDDVETLFQDDEIETI